MTISMSRRRPLQLASMPPRRAVGLLGPVPPPRQRECVRGQVAERPTHGDLRPSRSPPVVQRQEGFLPVAFPRVCIVVVLLYMFLEHAIVREILMSVLEPASIHTEVEAGGDPLDRQEAGIVRRTLKYRVNAAVICGAVDCAIRQQLQIAILEEHLYGAGGASYVAQVGGALRARLGRGGRGAGRERERRQEQPQRARARAHGAPRPWQPPGRRHCTTPPLIPRSTPHDFHHPVSSKSFLLYL